MADINDDTPLTFDVEQKPKMVHLKVHIGFNSFGAECHRIATLADLRTMLKQHPEWVKALGLCTGAERDAAVKRAEEAEAECDRLRSHVEWLTHHQLQAGQRCWEAQQEAERMRPVVEAVIRVAEPWRHSNSSELRALWRRVDTYRGATPAQPETSAEARPAGDDPTVDTNFALDALHEWLWTPQNRLRGDVTSVCTEALERLKAITEEAVDAQTKADRLREAVDICAQVESELLSESKHLLDGYAREAMANAAGAAMCGRRLRAALAAAEGKDK